MVERPKNHWKKQWGQWSAGQKTFNRIFSTLAKPLKTIDPNGVPEKNSFHSIALKNDSALQWVEVSPSPGMIYNPGCVAAHLASKKLFNIFWILFYLIRQCKTQVEKQQLFREAGCTGAEFSLLENWAGGDFERIAEIWKCILCVIYSPVSFSGPRPFLQSIMKTMSMFVPNGMPAEFWDTDHTG